MKLEWTSRIGAKSVFSNKSRDIIKNTLIAPLREVYNRNKYYNTERLNIAILFILNRVRGFSKTKRFCFPGRNLLSTHYFPL
jgi:hypothetical protein